MNTNNSLSYEERRKMVSGAKAVSPESAAQKLKFWADMPVDSLFHSTDDVNLVFERCGLDPYTEMSGVDIDHYRQFCLAYMYMKKDMMEICKDGFLENDENVNHVNSMIVLAEMVLDTLKNKSAYPQIYTALNMSMGDFWGAVYDMNVNELGKVDENRRKNVQQTHDYFAFAHGDEKSIKKTLGDILNDYMIFWTQIDMLSRIVQYDERLQSDADGKAIEEFEVPVSDFNDDKVKYIREEILLKERNYGPEHLKEMRKRIKNERLLVKFDTIVSSERFATSVKCCSLIARHIYFMLVMPFIGLNKYHYEGHVVM